MRRLYLKSGEALEQLLHLIPGGATAAGLHGQYGLQGRPGKTDGLGYDKELLLLPVNQRTFDQPDRQIAHERECDGEPVKASFFDKAQQFRLVELAGGIQRLNFSERLHMFTRPHARRGLDRIRRSADCTPDLLGLAGIGGLQPLSHPCRRLNKQFEKGLARNIRPRPNRQRDIAVGTGFRHQGGNTVI